MQMSTSQRQADMMQHAAHNAEYAAERSVPVELAAEHHATNIAVEAFGKTIDGACPKCEEAGQ